MRTTERRRPDTSWVRDLSHCSLCPPPLASSALSTPFICSVTAVDRSVPPSARSSRCPLTSRCPTTRTAATRVTASLVPSVLSVSAPSAARLLVPPPCCGRAVCPTQSLSMWRQRSVAEAAARVGGTVVDGRAAAVAQLGSRHAGGRHPPVAAAAGSVACPAACSYNVCRR